MRPSTRKSGGTLPSGSYTTSPIVSDFRYRSAIRSSLFKRTTSPRLCGGLSHGIPSGRFPAPPGGVSKLSVAVSAAPPKRHAFHVGSWSGHWCLAYRHEFPVHPRWCERRTTRGHARPFRTSNIAISNRRLSVQEPVYVAGASTTTNNREYQLSCCVANCANIRSIDA